MLTTTLRLPPSMAPDGNKGQKNVRLSETAQKILAKLAGKWGVSQASVLEMLLRAEDARPDVDLPPVSRKTRRDD